MNTKRLVSSLGGITVAIGLLLCALSAPVWAFGRPFAGSCLYGRYVAATTGLDVSAFELDPTIPNANIPLALAGEIDFTCTGTNPAHGAFTGNLVVTVPTEPAPAACTIGSGYYTIDPTTGAISMSATLSGACLYDGTIPSPYVSESGFLSDPSGATINAVETSQQDSRSKGVSGVVIHYIWTKQQQH
jgi:hypothetical protein